MPSRILVVAVIAMLSVGAVSAETFPTKDPLRADGLRRDHHHTHAMATLRPLVPADLADAQSVLLRSCHYDRASTVAEEQLFGSASRDPWRQTLGAFGAHDGNSGGLGWFGPTGTFHTHRNRGLGAALLLASLLDIARAGHEHATIAWIGPREFYEKTTSVIAETRFVVFEKALA